MGVEDAALYARISTEDQKKGYSIDDQIGWAGGLRDFNVVEVYKDEVAHSDTVDREDLQRLCRDIAATKVKVLLLRYHDRLGRGEVFGTLVQWLKAWKVRIICGDIPDSGDATDILLGFYGAQGGLFLKTLRERTRDGVARAKKEGKHVGNNLLGFHWTDGEWVPEEWAVNVESSPPLDLKPWQIKRVREAMRAYRNGRLNDLVQARSKASAERYRVARQKQELRARVFEKWLLDHRPLTMERVSL